MDPTQLTNWFHLPQRVLWALLLVSGLLLWGPSAFIQGLGLGAFIDTYRMYLGIVFLLFLAATLPTPIQWVAKLVWDKLRERQIDAARKLRLQDLSLEEKEILREYIDNNSKTQYLDVSDGVTASLEQSGIIYRATSVSHEYTDFAYNIRSWARDHLRENRHLLEQL